MMKVLVVENGYEQRRAIVDALVPNDKVAIQGAVSDVESALRAIQEHAPDIVVTGERLADGTSFELIEGARRADHPARIIVIGDTATREEWRRHLAAGAHRFVERDHELWELKVVVDAIARDRPPALDMPDPSDGDSLRLVGRLTAGVAHDLNNFLGVTSVMLALLEKHPDDRELLAQARESMARAVRLTSGLLAYARGEPQPPAPVQLDVVVRDIIEMLRRTLPAGVTVELDIADGLRPVRGVVHELEQLVANLVINAIDAMPDGGELRVRVQPTASAAVFLEISDTGVGIPPELAHNGRRGGLGLAIVNRVVESHHGSLRFGRRTSGGTIARVMLPT